MAVYIFNFSVDAPDAQPDYVSEDLSYNDMESVVEILLEQVLGFENAIAEHDEKDTEDGNSFDIKRQIVFFHQTKLKNNKVFDYVLHIIVTTNYEQYSSQFHPEIVPPPPKV